MVRSLGEVIVVLSAFGLLFEIYFESKGLFDSPVERIFTGTNLTRFVSLICAALVTYTLKVNVGISPVVSAALVGLIGSLILPAHAVSIYCGSFVGMTSSRLLITHSELGFAAIAAGILFLLTDRIFRGFGGKLGSIAFVGTFITGFGLKREFEIISVPEWNLVGVIIFFSVIATVVTHLLHVHFKHSTVLASAIVSITGGLILPNVYPGNTGMTLAVMVMCASFAGMSSAERFPKLLYMAAVGFLTGVLFIYSMPLAAGAGGKLGAIAFGSALAVGGYINLVRRFRKLLPST